MIAHEVRPATLTRATPKRPPHPALNVRDDREAPLFVRRDTREMPLICGRCEAIYFREHIWTTQISLKCFAKLVFCDSGFHSDVTGHVGRSITRLPVGQISRRAGGASSPMATSFPDPPSQHRA
jgi:hypothetical protein